MPKWEWDKLDNEDNKAMLELLITYLIGLVLKFHRIVTCKHAKGA